MQILCDFFCGSFMFFFLSCVCYTFVRVCLYVPCGHPLGKGWPLGSRLWGITMSLSPSHPYPGSGVVLDCIDSWSLHPYLLLQFDWRYSLTDAYLIYVHSHLVCGQFSWTQFDPWLRKMCHHLQSLWKMVSCSVCASHFLVYMYIRTFCF